jgi:hypothetical protein
VVRCRDGREPADVLLELQDRFDTHFLNSGEWDRARRHRTAPHTESPR